MGGERIKKTLILAPHQDDECLQTAGVIRAALLAGGQVTVCFATNGEYRSEGDAAVRAAESRRVLRRLGVSEERIIFLGYADTGMPYAESFLRRLYDGEAVAASRWGRRETWTPDGRDYRFTRDRSHGPYTAGSVRRDLAELLERLAPDEVYVSAPGDFHGDHDALGRFTVEAVAAVSAKRPDWRPEVYFYLIHADGADAWPDRWGGAFSVPPLPPCGPLRGAAVEHRPLPAGFSAGVKRRLIEEYASQEPEAYNGFLLAFAKEEELLFRAPPEEPAPS